MGEPLAAQLKKHKTELLVGGAGIAVAIGLYLRSRSTSSNSSTPAVVTGGYAPAAVPGTTVATTTGTDAYNGMENQILGLQQALMGYVGQKGQTPTPGAGAGSGSSAGSSGAKAPTPGNVPTVPYTEQAYHGQGYSIGNYQTGNVEGSTGGYFSTFGTYTETLQALEAGQTAFYEPSLGDFVPITSVGQFKALEHTQEGAQTTTYSKIGGGTTSSASGATSGNPSASIMHGGLVKAGPSLAAAPAVLPLGQTPSTPASSSPSKFFTTPYVGLPVGSALPMPSDYVGRPPTVTGVTTQPTGAQVITEAAGAGFFTKGPPGAVTAATGRSANNPANWRVGRKKKTRGVTPGGGGGNGPPVAGHPQPMIGHAAK